MEINAEDIKVLKKLVESPDWSVYQRVVESLKVSIKEYIPQIELTLSSEEYSRKVKNAVALITCLDKIDNEILVLLFKKDVSVKDILDELDPYTEKKK